MAVQNSAETCEEGRITPWKVPMTLPQGPCGTGMGSCRTSEDYYWNKTCFNGTKIAKKRDPSDGPKGGDQPEPKSPTPARSGNDAQG